MTCNNEIHHMFMVLGAILLWVLFDSTLGESIREAWRKSKISKKLNDIL